MESAFHTHFVGYTSPRGVLYGPNSAEFRGDGIAIGIIGTGLIDQHDDATFKGDFNVQGTATMTQVACRLSRRGSTPDARCGSVCYRRLDRETWSAGAQFRSSGRSMPGADVQRRRS
jgi:hypothetical protein